MECSICMGESVRSPVVTCCGHLFCWPCIFTWLDLQCRKNHGQMQAGSCPVCKGALSLQDGPSDFTPIYMAGSHDTEKYTDCNIPPRPSAARRQMLKAEPALQYPEDYQLDQDSMPEIDEQLAFLFPYEIGTSEPPVAADFPGTAFNLIHEPDLSQLGHPMLHETGEGGHPAFLFPSEIAFETERIQAHPEDIPVRDQIDEQHAFLFPSESVSERPEHLLIVQAVMQNFCIPHYVSQRPAYVSDYSLSWNIAVVEAEYMAQLAQAGAAGHIYTEEIQREGSDGAYSAFLPYASTNHADRNMAVQQLAARDGAEELAQSHLHGEGAGGNLTHGAMLREPNRHEPTADHFYQYSIEGRRSTTALELPLQHGRSMHPMSVPPLIAQGRYV